MSDAADAYDASHIKVLEGWEAVRTRPGMYVGSTGPRGLHQLVFEVVGRAVSEVLAGRAGTVDVTLTTDGGVRVADDGPGIGVEDAGDDDGPGLEALLTRMHAGAGPGGRDTVAMSLSGIELAVTNALTSRLTAEVRREGIHWLQEYARGVALTPPTSAGTTTRAGTTLTFWPDADLFETVEISYEVLAERFRELAFLNRRLDISLTDERPHGGARSVRYRFPGGARELVAFLDAPTGASVHPDIIAFEREDPRIAGTVEVALRWHGSPEERLRSYANSAPTPHGGTHMDGFRDGVTAAVNAHARERRLLRETAHDLTADQVGEGLTAVVSLKLDRPEFAGSTRGELGGAEVRACVAEAVREHLGTWLENHPEQAAAIVGRIFHSSRKD
ncbi:MULTISPECIES: ATP-binding protein [unclassified Streptomyces]|uniref:ATP-binding protein n=1 Tax=unclassified Streptomyces TaxID=2593676 RepID=UPI0006F851BA|nr:MULTISPECIES: ATP-binding protein [unclassified Streptomyces]KQX50160.1 DNA gyrase subunit B [Streptomyces sp. Root1304]KRA80249.1 DNA gyrase subunit B [Streptomyces sp. Root66D1]